MASAARSAASWRRSRSSGVNIARGEAADVQDAEDAALDEEWDAEQGRMPFSRRIGLRMSAWSTSGMAIARRSAAMRPAKPAPSGMRTPCSTSSSMPLAARACSVSPSSRRIATVSTSRMSDTRCSSSCSSVVLRQERERGVGDPLQRFEHPPRAAPGQRSGWMCGCGTGPILRRPVTQRSQKLRAAESRCSHAEAGLLTTAPLRLRGRAPPSASAWLANRRSPVTSRPSHGGGVNASLASIDGNSISAVSRPSWSPL